MHPGAARGGRLEAGQDLHGGGLAGAVRAQEADDLPLGHPEIDALERRESGKGLLQARDRDHLVHARPLTTFGAAQVRRKRAIVPRAGDIHVRSRCPFRMQRQHAHRRR